MENKKLKIILIILLLVLLIFVFLILAFKCDFWDIFKSNDNFNDDTDMSNEINSNLERGENYEALSDGTKINTSEQIENAEFVFDKIKVSEFKISEIDGSTTITGKIENTTSEQIENTTLVVKLYNSKDEVVHEYSMGISNIEPNSERYIQTSVMEDFANVARVEADIKE